MTNTSIIATLGITNTTSIDILDIIYDIDDMVVIKDIDDSIYELELTYLDDSIGFNLHDNYYNLSDFIRV